MVETFSPSMLLTILPEILLLGLAGLVLGVDLAWPRLRPGGLGWLTAGGCGVILGVALIFCRPGAGNALIFGGMLRADFIAFVFRMLFLFAGALVALFSLEAPGVARQGEYYVLLLVAVLGLNLMAAAADLVMLYLALETVAVAQAVLTGFLREDDKSAEAGLKYFLFSAFASTVMLYGFSLLYGFTGATRLDEVGRQLIGLPWQVVLPMLLLVLVGFGFKVAAVPFHFWAPDVYEGAPTPVTAFISTASKAAGFAVLLRVLLVVFPAATLPEVQSRWVSLMAALAVLTMTLGNLLALPQKNIKRLLAYSSIAQAGYVLVGVTAASAAGVAAAIFYLTMYTFTNLAAFGVVVLVARATDSDDLSAYAGLSRRSPGLALVLLVALLSLSGMPPLAGFFGKFFVFAAAVEQPVLIWLAVVGVLNAIVGLYYYLSVLKVVYLYRSEHESKKIPVSRGAALALGLCVVGILWLGTWATPWLTWATQAAANLPYR